MTGFRFLLLSIALHALIFLALQGLPSFNLNQKQELIELVVAPTPAYLQLYALDLLKRVCLQNFKTMLGSREQTVADLSFQFDINENNDPDRIAAQKIVIGNVLHFYRNSHQSIMKWELGSFRGMFPVPMAYLNIPWIQENWERIVDKKDPLVEFKKQFGG